MSAVLYPFVDIYSEHLAQFYREPQHNFHQHPEVVKLAFRQSQYPVKEMWKFNSFEETERMGRRLGAKHVPIIACITVVIKTIHAWFLRQKPKLGPMFRNILGSAMRGPLFSLSCQQTLDQHRL